MRNLIIFFIPLILFAYPLFADSHKRKILYGWETSNGIQLRGFGEKSVHPLYEGDTENAQPNGLGIMTFPDGNGRMGKNMVMERSHTLMELNLLENGKIVKCGT